MTNRSSSTMAGQPCLTGREAQIIAMIAAGHSNAGIADRLFLTEKSVKNYVNRIYGKLGAVSRSDAISRWQGEAAQAAATVSTTVS
jgi:DNA-binding CsgD family transcriptional regulator